MLFACHHGVIDSVLEVDVAHGVLPGRGEDFHVSNIVSRNPRSTRRTAVAN